MHTFTRRSSSFFLLTLSFTIACTPANRNYDGSATGGAGGSDVDEGGASTGGKSAKGGSSSTGGSRATSKGGGSHQGGTVTTTSSTVAVATGGTENATGGSNGSSTVTCTDCGNSDETHCRCASVNGVCSVVAKDSDGDSHGDMNCTASPGTDCNDVNANIHPGATEICDGVDNNCNGKADIFDGLPLGGTTDSLSITTPNGGVAAAWSTANGEYLVAVSNKMQRISTKGLAVGSSWTTAEAPSTGAPKLAAGSNGYALVYDATTFLSIDGKGATTAGPVTLFADAAGDVANRFLPFFGAAGRWFVLFDSTQSSYSPSTGYQVIRQGTHVVTLPADASSTDPASPAYNNSQMPFASRFKAAQSGEFIYAVGDVTGGGLRLATYRTSRVPTASVIISSSGTVEALGARSDRVLVSGRQGLQPTLAEYSVSGAPLCTENVSSDLWSGTVSAGATFWWGVTKGAVDANFFTPTLRVVPLGCGTPVDVALSTDKIANIEASQGVSVAWGEAGGIVVWSGSGSGTRFRVFGPLLCNAP